MQTEQVRAKCLRFDKFPANSEKPSIITGGRFLATLRCDSTPYQHLHPSVNRMTSVCAIDFGTSNSAIALPQQRGVKLVELEPGYLTMPTAAFYSIEGLAGQEDPIVHYGRAAVGAYVEGSEGRLMRSMKSILGSTLATQATDVGGGRAVPYLDVVSGYLRHLKTVAQRESGTPLSSVVLGRPVFFVDDDPKRDAAAQAALAKAARNVGFKDISFQFEPIAAALDFESGIDNEQLVLVADIGGGTSDFSLVRIGPKRRDRVERKDDILANHGVHIAGTDFDRRIELKQILPSCGYGSLGPTGREVPSKIYFDLATWHLINTTYGPARMLELAQMKSFYGDSRHHQRLLRVLTERLGHGLIARAETTKIHVAQTSTGVNIDLSELELGLQVTAQETDVIAAIDDDLDRIALAAQETLHQAGVKPAQVTALYFTGGSTGLPALAARIAKGFPAANVVRGDRFSSVATGLGLHAQRVFA